MFYKQLKYFRNSLGYSQSKVAQLLNITQAAYSYYELGTREPTFDTLRKLCVIFNCTADELLEIDTPSQRKQIVLNNTNK